MEMDQRFDVYTHARDSNILVYAYRCNVMLQWYY